MRTEWQLVEQRDRIEQINIQTRALNILQEAWRTDPETNWRNYKKAWLREFRLRWRLKAIRPNVDSQVHQNCTNSAFALCTEFTFMFAQVSIKHCIPIFLAKLRNKDRLETFAQHCTSQQLKIKTKSMTWMPSHYKPPIWLGLFF